MVRALICITVLLLGLGLSAPPSGAEEPVLDQRMKAIQGFCAEGQSRFTAVETMLRMSASSVEQAKWAATIVAAAMTKRLTCATNGAVIKDGSSTVDAVTLLPTAAASEGVSAVLVNLKVRGALEVAADLISLIVDPMGTGSKKAIANIEKNAKLAEPAALDAAIAAQKSSAHKERLETVKGIRALNDPDPAVRVHAVELLKQNPSQKTLTTLINLTADKAYGADEHVRAALQKAIAEVRSWITVADVGSVLFSGLSYASILFLASVGLTIIFGLMGVINLAQGELIMVGAYATYLVQEVLKLAAPALVSLYLLLAIPIAFLAAALIGVTIEVTVIRHLYRRPLITLLATWAVSLLVINTVRVAFGTQNLEFVTPEYLAGGFQVIGDFIITWNRLFAILCAVLTFVIALLILKFTKLGLFIRAVITNREMADCIGVSVRRVDMLSFGIGSGLAGVAGLALSPIYNVNPSMGSNFIVDAFMIVVLGGVGSIVGTLVASLGVGIVNVAIEPLYGAVAAKVIVLLMIIAFIQFRPEGMFVVKGRR